MLTEGAFVFRGLVMGREGGRWLDEGFDSATLSQIQLSVSFRPASWYGNLACVGLRWFLSRSVPRFQLWPFGNRCSALEDYGV